MAGERERSNSSPEAGDGDEHEINGPLVFQCGTCQTIVGDSFSLIEAVQELDLIVLRGASDLGWKHHPALLKSDVPSSECLFLQPY